MSRFTPKDLELFDKILTKTPEDEERKEAFFLKSHAEDTRARRDGIADRAAAFLKHDHAEASPLEEEKKLDKRKEQTKISSAEIEAINDAMVKQTLTHKTPARKATATRLYLERKRKVSEEASNARSDAHDTFASPEEEFRSFANATYKLEKRISAPGHETLAHTNPQAFGDRCEHILRKAEIEKLDPDFSSRKAYARELRGNIDNLRESVSLEQMSSSSVSLSKVEKSLKNFKQSMNEMEIYEGLAPSLPLAPWDTKETIRANTTKYLEDVKDIELYRVKESIIKNKAKYSKLSKTPAIVSDEAFKEILDRKEALDSGIRLTREPIKSFLKYESVICMRAIDNIDPSRERRARGETEKVTKEVKTEIASPHSAHSSFHLEDKTPKPLEASDRSASSSELSSSTRSSPLTNSTSASSTKGRTPLTDSTSSTPKSHYTITSDMREASMEDHSTPLKPTEIKIKLGLRGIQALSKQKGASH